jgi:hypothetical protein
VLQFPSVQVLEAQELSGQLTPGEGVHDRQTVVLGEVGPSTEPEWKTEERIPMAKSC